MEAKLLELAESKGFKLTGEYDGISLVTALFNFDAWLPPGDDEEWQRNFAIRNDFLVEEHCREYAEGAVISVLEEHGIDEETARTIMLDWWSPTRIQRGHEYDFYDELNSGLIDWEADDSEASETLQLADQLESPEEEDEEGLEAITPETRQHYAEQGVAPLENPEFESFTQELTDLLYRARIQQGDGAFAQGLAMALEEDHGLTVTDQSGERVTWY